MCSTNPIPLTRRELLSRAGAGFGAMGLASIFGLARADELGVSTPLSPKAGHFPAKAKRVIYLFMNGGPSHVDTFDPKPMLAKRNGEDAPAGSTSRKGSKLMQSPFK